MRKAVRFQTAVAPDRFDVKQLRWVTVAPDGSRVVYSALGHLYVKDLPSGTPRRLTRRTTASSSTRACRATARCVP